MDDSFDKKIKQLLEDGKKLGYNPLSPNSVFKHQESSIKDKLVETFGLNEQLNQTSAKEDDEGSEISSVLFSKHFNDSEIQSENDPETTGGGNFSLGDLAKEFHELISDNQQHKCMKGDTTNKSEMSRNKQNLSYVEIALENAQMEVAYLNKKIAQNNKSRAQLKTEFRKSIEDLQAKLQDAMFGRRNLLKAHEQEMNEQEEVVTKLQETVKELFVSNQHQEGSLLDACEKIRVLDTDKQNLESELERMKNLIMSAGKKLSSLMISGNLMGKKVANLTRNNIVESLQAIFTLIEDDNESLKRKMLQLELERNAYKEEHKKEKNKISSLEQEFETQRVMSEYCTEETTSKNKELRVNNEELQQELSKQIKLNEKISIELSKKNEEYRKENVKHHSLMDDLEKQIFNSKCDLKLANDLVRRLQDDNNLLNQRFDENKLLVDDLKKKIEQYEERNNQLVNHQTTIEELRKELKEKNSEVLVLRETVSQVRSNIAMEINEKVKDVEQTARMEVNIEVGDLERKNSELQSQISELKSINDENEKRLSEVIIERSDLLKKYEDSFTQIEDLNVKLKAKEDELNLLQAEENSAKKESEKLLKDRSEVLKLNQHLQRDLDSCQLTLKEKEILLAQANDQLKNVMKKFQEMIQERDETEEAYDNLQVQLKDRSHEVSCLKNELMRWEDCKEKMQNKMQNMLEEKQKFIDMSNEKQNGILELTKSKFELENEIIEIRAQVGHLVYERESLDSELREIKEKQQEKINNYKSQVKITTSELQRAQEALDILGNSDGCTAVVAAQMQCEVTNKRALVDQLKMELSKANDKIKTSQRENKKTKKSFFQLVEKFGQLESEMQKAKDELKHKVKKEKGYKIALEKLQSALERAAKKNHQAQSIIDQRYEQITNINDINQKLLLFNKRTTTDSITQNWQQMIASARNSLIKFDGNHQTNVLDVRMSNTEISTLHNHEYDKQIDQTPFGKDVKEILFELRDYMRRGSQNSSPSNSIQRNLIDFEQDQQSLTTIPENEEDTICSHQTIVHHTDAELTPRPLADTTANSLIKQSENSAFSAVFGNKDL